MNNRERVIERVRECLQIAGEAYKRDFKMPTVKFTKRGQVAGTANSTTWVLNFNEELLNDNLEDFVKQTVAHEVAHLIDHAVYNSHAPRFDAFGRRKKRPAHGEKWKTVMRVLGVEPKRCHNYKTKSARNTKTHPYKCMGCNQVLQMGTIRHRRMMSGEKRYMHCRGFALLPL